MSVLVSDYIDQTNNRTVTAMESLQRRRISLVTADIESHRRNMLAMKTVGKNILAVIAGVVLGSLVNIALVNLGPMIVPLPEGADISTMEKLQESMKLFTPVNFLFPFLAHALGTLVGAFIAARLAASHAFILAMCIGVFFLIGGIAAVNMLGGPTWFKVTDLVFAYLPMAFLGATIASKSQNKATVTAD